jgi:hypothetical protein
MSQIRTRRTLLTVAAAVVALSTSTYTGIAGANTQPAGETLAPKLVWTPDPARDGLNAFEGIEDRNSADPGTKHIAVRDGAWRFDMHRRDRDGSDRQRQEVKGMRQAGQMLEMKNGSTWRITYDMFIPTTLHGTSKFSHIFQLKMPGTGTGPLVTMSLRRSGGEEQIALRAFESGGDIGSAALAPLRNKWISIDMTFRIGNSGSGRFIVRDGDQVVVDKSRSGIDIWLGDRIRPKWGIYRSIGSASTDIIDTYLLIRNMRAYEGA